MAVIDEIAWETWFEEGRIAWERAWSFRSCLLLQRLYNNGTHGRDLLPYMNALALEVGILQSASCSIAGWREQSMNVRGIDQENKSSQNGQSSRTSISELELRA